MNSLLLISLLLSFALTACGTDEAEYEAPHPAPAQEAPIEESDALPKPMCKTDVDGTVYRIETNADAIDLRESLAKLGFRACD